MSDLISRQAAVDALWKALFEYEDKTEKQFQESEDLDIQDWIQHRIFVQNMSDIDRQTIIDLPPVQPDVPDMNVGEIEPSRESNTEITRCSNDTISRQVAQHKINALIDEFETIMKDIRERHVDDSVCGLCEYDGAFMSDSGDWCNECPGFERDDCFKLKDQYREEWAGAIKNLPPAQPERRCVNCGRTVNNGGWYEDGRTRCPIEEHYALPKDGYCHLWEKRKDWEDDYVKRAEEGEK